MSCLQSVLIHGVVKKEVKLPEKDFLALKQRVATKTAKVEER